MPHVVLGTAVRTLGGFPSGWRQEGAHNDPAADPRALRRLAKEAERAHLDYLFFGDWLSSSLDLEYTDPYLLGRIDPLSATAYLAATTKHIGLIGTVNASFADPFEVARTAASIDQLSGGRFGLNLTVGTEPLAEANRAPTAPGENRHDVAAEFVQVLRGVWDSWADDAFVRDARGGRLVDPAKVRPVSHEGRYFRVAGPGLARRPVQGHVPLMHSDFSLRARAFAIEQADVHVISPRSRDEAVATTAEIRAGAVARGRGADAVTVVIPLLPVVGATREEAWGVYDRLVERVPVAGDGEAAEESPLAQRTAATLRRFVGVPLLERSLDDAVSVSDVERFNPTGRRLARLVASRSGRTPGGARPLDYRHLLVAQLFPAPIVVGSAEDVADHIEDWFRAGAGDGFTIQSAFLHEQFEAFARLVVPILVERGLFRADYESDTLRGHLGSPRPDRSEPGGPSTGAPPSPPEAPHPSDRYLSSSAFDGVIGFAQ